MVDVYWMICSLHLIKILSYYKKIIVWEIKFVIKILNSLKNFVNNVKKNVSVMYNP